MAVRNLVTRLFLGRQNDNRRRVAADLVSSSQVRRSNFITALMAYSDGTSFRAPARTFAETRAACGANPFSNRLVHHGRGVRRYRAMEETTRLGDNGLLQLAGGRDFNNPRFRHWATRVAVPTRGAEAEGNSLAAPRSGVCFNGDDLAGVVGAFPRPAADGIPAKLSSGP